MRYLALFFLFAFEVFAADVTGTWKGTVEPSDGEERVVIVKIKAKDSKLAGTVTLWHGAECEIEEGKVDGDKVSFLLVQGDLDIECTGKVSGKEIKLEMIGGARHLKVTLKKQ
jgi:hypothetical protein